MKNLIVDTVNDTDYYTEVRDLLGVSSEDLSDTTLKSDIILGTAEREVCGSFVNNWISILNGSDPIKQSALRACVIIRVAFNIIDSPAVQNILIDQIRMIDTIITSKKVSIEEVKAGLLRLFEKQLAQVGVEHAGGWPDRNIIGKTDTYNFYDYVIDTEGNVQEAVS